MCLHFLANACHWINLIIILSACIKSLTIYFNNCLPDLYCHVLFPLPFKWMELSILKFSSSSVILKSFTPISYKVVWHVCYVDLNNTFFRFFRRNSNLQPLPPRCSHLSKEIFVRIELHIQFFFVANFYTSWC